MKLLQLSTGWFDLTAQCEPVDWERGWVLEIRQFANWIPCLVAGQCKRYDVDLDDLRPNLRSDDSLCLDCERVRWRKMIYGVEYSGELQEQPKTPRHVRELIKLDLACRGKDFSTFPAIQQLFDMPWRVTSTDDIFVQRAIDPEGRTLWPATQQEKKWRPTKAEDD